MRVPRRRRRREHGEKRCVLRREGECSRVQLPHGKIELGTSVGKSGCAIVAVTDIGLASSAVEKLASEHEEYAETAKLLSEKNARIQSRKGIKKQKNKAETETEKAG